LLLLLGDDDDDDDGKGGMEILVTERKKSLEIVITDLQ
jgi:hypothetical protein